MYQAAGDLGMPVCHMPFKGLLGHIDEIEDLATSYPRTPVIIDHFGFCKGGDTGSEEWRRLLNLARHPQVLALPEDAHRPAPFGL
jgi:predicted TIM-barrel fold metal-dependent hydrolase